MLGSPAAARAAVEAASDVERKTPRVARACASPAGTASIQSSSRWPAGSQQRVASREARRSPHAASHLSAARAAAGGGWGTLPAPLPANRAPAQIWPAARWPRGAMVASYRGVGLQPSAESRPPPPIITTYYCGISVGAMRRISATLTDPALVKIAAGARPEISGDGAGGEQRAPRRRC
jgi:hypothetical protein